MKKLFIILGFLFVLGLCFIAQPAMKVAAAGYTVTFDANGGTGEMAPVTVTTPKYTLPDCLFGAPQGKEFKCWKVYGDTKDYNVGASIKVTKDVKLIAQWKLVESGSSTPDPTTPDPTTPDPTTPEPSVTPQPSTPVQEEKKGCGAKAVYIVGFGALALGAVILIKRKQF